MDAIEAVGGNVNVAALRIDRLERAGTSTDSRLGELTTRLDAMAARLDASEARINAAASLEQFNERGAALVSTFGATTAEQDRRLAQVEAALAASRTELATAQAELAALAGRLNEAAQAGQASAAATLEELRQADLARSKAMRMALAVQHLGAKLQTSRPFEREIDVIRRLSAGNPAFAETVAVLGQSAGTGVATLSELRESYNALVAPRILTAVAATSQRGIGERVGSWLEFGRGSGRRRVSAHHLAGAADTRSDRPASRRERPEGRRRTDLPHGSTGQHRRPPLASGSQCPARRRRCVGRPPLPHSQPVGRVTIFPATGPRNDDMKTRAFTAAALTLAIGLAQPALAQSGGSAPPMLAPSLENPIPAPLPGPINPAPEAAAANGRLLALGLGALGGVVAFNLATGGLSALPLIGGAGAATGALSASEGAVAVSRVYAVSSSLVGALVADWLTSPESVAPVRSGKLSTSVAYRVMP